MLYEGPHNVNFHIPNNLAKHWDKNSLAVIKKRNQDKVYIVDGMEGAGKSTWAFQQMAYLDPEAFKDPETFTSRIAFSPDDFFNLVRKVKNGVIVFDEAFRGFSSRAALSKINRKLVQALMEMRQNNNMVFIVLPSIFLLDQYPAMLRSSALFNIYINKTNGKRVWRGWNRDHKNMIYQQGAKKGWKYPVKTLFRGYFYGKFPGGEEFQKAYEEKKSKALIDMDKGENKLIEDDKPSILAKLFAANLYLYMNKHERISQNEIANKIFSSTKGKVSVSREYLSRAMEKTRAIDGLFVESEL